MGIFIQEKEFSRQPDNVFAGRISQDMCERQSDLRGGYTLRSSGRCGLVFKLDRVGMGALNA